MTMKEKVLAILEEKLEEQREIMYHTTGKSSILMEVIRKINKIEDETC